MGARGPSKKPKVILQMSGGWRGKYRGDEPEPEKAKLRCLSWLRPMAKTAWRKVVRQMGDMGILTMADENLVARYCQTWARWRAADEFIAAKGEGYPVYKDGKVASIHKYPHTVVASQLLSELTKMEDRLGLSPSARASLAVENKGNIEYAPEEKARFFRAG